MMLDHFELISAELRHMLDSSAHHGSQPPGLEALSLPRWSVSQPLWQLEKSTGRPVIFSCFCQRVISSRCGSVSAQASTLTMSAPNSRANKKASWCS